MTDVSVELNSYLKSAHLNTTSRIPAYICMETINMTSSLITIFIL